MEMKRKLCQINSSSFFLNEVRTRNFEHVDGNWPTHIYIPVPKAVCEGDLEKSAFKILSGNSNLNPIHPQADLHLSLSRCFTLREHQLEQFRNDLQDELENVSQFKINFENECQIFLNDQKKTSFACALVNVGFENVCKVIDRVDQVLEQYRKQKYYENPMPHVSFAWTVGNVAGCAEWKRPKPLVVYEDSEGSDISDDEQNEQNEQKLMLVDRICMKAGNREYKFPLE
mmetsp:Transcript_2543/g.3226  ORF Transcript_2543/g.3226 Transcript_2543/m.3226 type:complete len:229 (+) Transcript_2543:112-798(+)